MKTYKVLLDTNIYDEANYSFSNTRFSSMQHYAEKGYLCLLINSIIKGEVEKHIRERLKKASQAINEDLNEFSRDLASFHYDEPYKSRLAPLDKDDMASVCISRFNDFLNACHAEVLSHNDIDIESMITDYFQRNPPFQEAKPEEFKDAMTIRSFINYISDAEQTSNRPNDIICVISADKGFRKGIKRFLPNNSPVSIYNKLDDFISAVAAQDKRIQALTCYLESNNVDDEIGDIIQEFIESVSYYVDEPTDEFDVHNVDNIIFHLLWVDIIDDNEAKAIFDVEASVEVWYSYIDEDDSCFDKEEWVYLWKTEIQKTETHKINFEITLKIDLTDFGAHIDDPENGTGGYVFAFEDECIGVSEITDSPRSIELNEDTCLKSDVTKSDPFDEEDGEREYAIDTCPDCGSPIGISNDGGNGFCINCACNQ